MAKKKSRKSKEKPLGNPAIKTTWVWAPTEKAQVCQNCGCKLNSWFDVPDRCCQCGVRFFIYDPHDTWSFPSDLRKNIFPVMPEKKVRRNRHHTQKMKLKPGHICPYCNKKTVVLKKKQFRFCELCEIVFNSLGYEVLE